MIPNLSVWELLVPRSKSEGGVEEKKGGDYDHNHKNSGGGDESVHRSIQKTSDVIRGGGFIGPLDLH